ncbi:MAG: hypothetical protein C5B48_05695 [Candidatus Rokuibacteriota bacterium]|nr:MAG: hypothetical protein C5B48_05695 [Candidatus Rokubacteria bacterium]
MQTIVKAVVAIVTVFLCQMTAEAADSCFVVGSAANTLVAKAFTLPLKGTCKPFNGFFKSGDATYFHTGDWVHGTACGSSDNEWINFQLSAHGYSLHTRLHRSNLEEGSSQPCYYNYPGLGAGVCLGPLGFSKGTCSPSIVPVPE